MLLFFFFLKFSPPWLHSNQTRGRQAAGRGKHWDVVSQLKRLQCINPAWGPFVLASPTSSPWQEPASD